MACAQVGRTPRALSMRARLPREAADAQKNHPVAWWSLLLAAIAVMAVGVTLLGILMKRLRLDEPAAHRRLQTESQKRRISLAELAKKIIESEKLLGD